MDRPLLRHAIAAVVLTALPATATGCSADKSTGGRVAGSFATVYSSLPAQGPNAEQSREIVNAQKLALRDVGGEAGRFKVNFAFSNDATAEGTKGAPGWNPDKVAANARSAAQNSRTIAYVGEFNSGATAVSLPITNGTGIVQVSPASTATGLTRAAEGVDKGEPDKYYPSGRQTFARVVPADDVQASAAANWAKELGSQRVYLLGDKSAQGAAKTEHFRLTAASKGLQVVEERTMDPRADDYRELAQRISRTSPDTIYYSGGPITSSVRLWQDLHAAMPTARLMCSDQLLVPAFYEALGDSADNTYLTSSVQDPQQLPARGRRFVRAYRRAFKSSPGPYAAYGYAAMQIVLDAIARAGEKADQRDEVVKAVLATRELNSPIGRFSIDAGGDTSLDRIAGYRIRNDRPSFSASLRGRRSPSVAQP